MSREEGRGGVRYDLTCHVGPVPHGGLARSVLLCPVVSGTTTYALWVHRWTREVYAVRREGLRVTGICGPLPLSQVAPALCLALLPYDERPAALYRVQEYPEQFALALAWLEGRDVPVGVAGSLRFRGLGWLALWWGVRDPE